MLKRTLTSETTSGIYPLYTVRWSFLGITIYSAQRITGKLS